MLYEDVSEVELCIYYHGRSQTYVPRDRVDTRTMVLAAKSDLI